MFFQMTNQPRLDSVLKRLAFVAGVGIMAIGSGCGRGTVGEQKSRITVVSYGGGTYQESHRKAFLDPFTEVSGTQTDSVVWNADYGKLKTMVDSGNVSWDVVDVTAAQYQRGVREKMFADLTVRPHDGRFLPDSVNNQGVANVYWGTVLAYRKGDFKDRQPATWADFWDVRAFPGDRGLYDDPRGNLEFALLADGVPANQLYPLDVERAFRKLDQIKPYVRVWWTDGTQPVQLLLTKAVALSSAWNGRIYGSEQARNELGYAWNGAGLELDYWVIPRGSKNVDAASRFIVFASSPSALAKQTEIVGYGPVNLDALDHVSASAKPHLPTFDANWKVSFVVNGMWWADREEDLKKRWLSWKAR